MVDTASVKVFLDAPEDEFDITADAQVTITADDVTLDPAVDPQKELQAFQQVSTVAGNVLTDPNAAFITDGIRPGDIVNFNTAGPLVELDSVLSAQVGDYTVLDVPDENTLQLTPALIEENKVEYKIVRKGSNAGNVLITYRAQRFDLVGQLRFIQDQVENEQVIGVSSDQNPLGLGVQMALLNTELAVAATAVGADTLTEHQKASEFLEGKGVYAIAPLTQSNSIFTLWEQHVEQQSDAETGFPRVVLICPIAEDFTEFQASQVAVAAVPGGFPDSTFTDAGADFSAVPVGSVLRITAVTGAGLEIDGVPRVLPFEVQIASKNSSTSVEILGSFTVDPVDVTYSVKTLDFTNFQKANNVKELAQTFANRRVWFVFPETCQIEVDGVVKNLPGYYAAAGYAGLRSGSKPSQPLSRSAIAGLAGVVGSNEAFTPAQLKIIQQGGVMILEQRVADGPVTVRRQLTTSIVSLKQAEQTGTVVPDFVTYFLQEGLDPIVGRFLITKDFLENQVRPAINGMLRDLIEERIIGPRTTITSVGVDPNNADTVLVEVDLQVLDPANFIDITLRIQ